MSSDLSIVYINSHHKNGFYVREANDSAKSFRQYFPDAKYYLYTDLEDVSRIDQFDSICNVEFYVPEFMQNRVHLNGQMIVKHQALLDMQSKYVLYLGADTYALKKEVRDLLRMMERFDLIAAHAPVRVNTSFGNSSIPEIPICYPEFNCDLILYRNNNEVRSLVKAWQKDYLEDRFSHAHDQGTFRYLVYNSGLRVAALPEEWNYRGDEYRESTIILQNRFCLHKYKSKSYIRRWKLYGRIKKILESFFKV